MNQFLADVGHSLWRATWQGGIFVVAVFVICRLLTRLPASIRHWLWWLACLQMPVRFLFFSPVALPVLPALPPPVLSSMIEAPPAESASAEIVRSVTPRQVASVTTLPSNPNEPISAATVLLFGWGFGVVTVLVLATRRLVRTRLLLKGSTAAPGAALSLTRELSSRLRVPSPAVRESEVAPCPIFTGWFRPTIVLPAGFSANRDEAELRMAIAHELVHLKRRDLWLAGAPLLTQALFFFHPLAWLAIRESAAACEEACDMEAMRLGGGSPSAYARLLLSSTQSDVPIAALGTAFGFRLLQRRITMLSQSNIFTKPSVRRGFTALIALGVACSIPWTITAQTPPAPAVYKAPKAAAPTHKRRITHHHLAKKASRAKPSKIAARPALARPFFVAYSSAPQAPGVVFGGTMPAFPPSAVRSGQGVPTPPRNSPAQPFRYPATASAPVAAYVGAVAPKRIRPPTAASMPIAAPAYATAPVPTASGFIVVPPAADEPSPMAVSTDNGRVTVDMHNVDIVTALRTVFKAAHIDFTIKSTVAHDRVTCALTQVDIRTAIHAILEAARQELTYRVEAGVYMIAPRNSALAAPTSDSGTGSGWSSPTTSLGGGSTTARGG